MVDALLFSSTRFSSPLLNRTTNTENMGQFLLRVPDEIIQTVDNTVWDDMYFAGIDGTPWQTKTEFQDGLLTVEIKVPSSGKFHIPWKVEGVGTRILSTCSLAPSEERQYDLMIELARGSCYRARILGSEWERLGIQLDNAFNQHVEYGTNCFINALTKIKSSESATKETLEAISHHQQALDLIAQDYAERSIAQRKQRDPKLTTLLAGSVLATSEDTAADQEIACLDLFAQTFNTAAVRLNWRDIQANPDQFNFTAVVNLIKQYNQIGLRTIAGPMIDLERELMPDWLMRYADQPDALEQASLNYLEKSVTQLKGTVQLWNCLSGINRSKLIPMDDERMMRFSLSALQTIRRLDPETPTILSFDQPFGEYLRKPNSGMPGLKIAETLARSGLGMAGIGLDIKVNYGKHGSMPRSAIDFSQKLDRWGTLGLPLLVQISAPGSAGKDEQSLFHQNEYDNSSPQENSPEDQLENIAPLLQILLAKPYVHGIVWDGWADQNPHFMPHSGLIGIDQKARPLQQHLCQLRADHLG